MDQLGAMRRRIAELEEAETTRKRAEEALVESAERYRVLLESITEGILVQDREFRCLLVNDELARMAQMPKEKLLGSKMTDLFPGVERSVFYKTYKKVMETGQPAVASDVFVFEDGRRCWYEVHVYAAPEGVLAIVVDITKSKKAMEKLRQYKFMVESAQDAIFFKDLESRYIIANNKTVEAFGLSPGEVIGKNDYELMREQEEARKNVDDDRLVFERGKPTEVIKHMTGADGTERWFQAIKVPQLNDKGEVIGLVGIARDISELKRAQEALEKSRTELRSILSSMNDLVFGFDSEGRFTFCHDPTHSELYATSEKFMGKKHTEVMPPEVNELFLEAFAKNKKGQVAEYEYSLQMHGDTRWYSVKLSPMLLRGEFIGSVAVIRNVTERKRAEQELITYQERLRSLASALALAEERERRRIATALHDGIGQTLAVTKLKLDALKARDFSPNDSSSLEEIGGLLSEIIQSTRSLTFELSPPVLYELGLEAAIQWLTERLAEQHGIRCDFADDRKSKPLDESVRVVLFQAVRELLNNVVKHSQAKRAQVAVKKSGDTICIRVKDDGAGFDPASIGSEVTRSAGFGLFNIRERLGQFGGSIDVKSQPGQATRVTLIAPLRCIPKDQRTPGNGEDKDSSRR